MKPGTTLRTRFWLLVSLASGVVFLGWLIWFGREIRSLGAREPSPTKRDNSRPKIKQSLQNIFGQVEKSFSNLNSDSIFEKSNASEK